MAHESLDLLGPTRATILLALKRHVETTAEALASEVYLTVGATRQQLARLEADGLVAHTTRHDGAGRPPHVFRLTDAAEALFPTVYEEFATGLMSVLALEPTDVRERVFRRLIAAFFAPHAGGAGHADNESTFAALLGVFSEYGYMPTTAALDDGTHIMDLNHCPLLSLARAHPMICAMEWDGLSASLPGYDVTRPAWRLEGSAHCAYAISEVRRGTDDATKRAQQEAPPAATG